MGDSDRRSLTGWMACSEEVCSGETCCGSSNGSDGSSASGEESKSSMATRCLDFLAFSGFGSDEEGDDLRTDVMGEKIPPLCFGSG